MDTDTPVTFRLQTRFWPSSSLDHFGAECVEIEADQFNLMSMLMLKTGGADMPSAHTIIEDAVIDILAHTGPCTIDEVVQSLPAHEWSEVFFAVDTMSRDGRLVFRRSSSSVYELRLSAPSQEERTTRARPMHEVQFCLGCGYLCDESRPGGGRSTWIEANRYLKKYGVTWFEVQRIDTMCPACSHVQACGTRQVFSRAVAIPAVR